MIRNDSFKLFSLISVLKFQGFFKIPPPEDMFVDFRESKRDKERKRERERDEREASICCLPYAPQPESNSKQVCALTGDQTCNLLVDGMILQPTRLPGQGKNFRGALKFFHSFLHLAQQSKIGQEFFSDPS